MTSLKTPCQQGRNPRVTLGENGKGGWGLWIEMMTGRQEMWIECLNRARIGGKPEIGKMAP